MLISVVVPVFNVEKYLEECINSIITQSYADMEIILVDDGSEDASGSICDFYVQKDSRVQVIHQKNKGLAGARNSGARIATGEYIYFVDADDELAKDAIITLVNKVGENQPDLCLFGYYKIRGGKDDEIVSIIPLPKDQCGLVDLDGFIDRIKNVEFNKFVGYEPVWDKLYKLSIMKDNNQYFDENVVSYEDREFNLRYLNYCKKILVIKDCIYRYFIRSIQSGVQTLSSNYKKDHFAITNTSYLKCLKPFLEKHNKFSGEYLTGFYHDYLNEIIKAVFWIVRSDNIMAYDDKIKELEKIVYYFHVEEAAKSFKCRNILEDDQMPQLIINKDVKKLFSYAEEKTKIIYEMADDE